VQSNAFIDRLFEHKSSGSSIIDYRERFTLRSSTRSVEKARTCASKIESCILNCRRFHRLPNGSARHVSSG
jgi:hypothetical protein